MSYNDNYLIHYGVKGMRWGHRKDRGYSPSVYGYSNSGYKSRKTKKLERKSFNTALKSNTLKEFSKNRNYNAKTKANYDKRAQKLDAKARKLHGQAVASKKRDSRMIKEYTSASLGRKFFNTLVAGPAGHTYVSSMKASGVSKGKAYAMSYMTGVFGAAYYRNKSIKSEGKKYEKSYKNHGYYNKRR